VELLDSILVIKVYTCLQEWKQGLSKLEAKIESGEEDTEQIQKREKELEQAIQR